MSRTPLHDAAESGDLDKARELLETGKYNVNNTEGIYRDTPLHSACRGGHLDMVRMLISEFKADMNIMDRINNTPLHEAAQYGKNDVVLASMSFVVTPTSEARMVELCYIMHVKEVVLL